MAFTGLFRNGNPQAVRIPSEPTCGTMDLIIGREGDALRIRSKEAKCLDVNRIGRQIVIQDETVIFTGN